MKLNLKCVVMMCCSTINKYPKIVNPYAKREEELLEATVRKTAVK